MSLSIGFYGAHCAPLHRLCHMWSLMYSISNRDFYVFYFCALQLIIFHGAHLSLSYIDCAIYKVCNKFWEKITKISRNIFTKKAPNDNLTTTRKKLKVVTNKIEVTRKKYCQYWKKYVICYWMEHLSIKRSELVWKYGNLVL